MVKYTQANRRQQPFECIWVYLSVFGYSVGLAQGYLRNKTIAPQNVLSEAQVKNFFIS